MQSNVQTLSGNRIAVEFDGKVVGLVQTLKASDKYTRTAATGIGDIHAVEHVPTMADHTLVVTAMTLITSHLRNAGVASENGDAVLLGNVFDFCVYSKDSGELLRKYVGCSYEGGDVEVSANKIVTQTATFKALDVVGTGL